MYHVCVYVHRGIPRAEPKQPAYRNNNNQPVP